MMFKRLFPLRWARIAAWTGAALAWGTTAIAVASSTSPSVPAEPPALPLALEPPTTTSTTTTLAPVPELPQRGLVVVRYTPVPPPPPKVVTRTVVVAGSSGGGGSSAAPAAPAPAAPAAAAPAPSAPVQSSGS